MGGYAHLIERLGFERARLARSLDDERQRGGLHAPARKPRSIERVENGRSVHAHKPIGLGSPARRIGKAVVCGLGLGRREVRAHLLGHKGGRPEALDGLRATGELVNAAEDVLALAVGVAGVDDALDVGRRHELLQDLELIFSRFRNVPSPFGRHHGQIPHADAGELRVLARQIKADEMAVAPAKKVAVAGNEAVLALMGADGFRYPPCDARFFRDYQNAHALSPSSFCDA